MHRLLPEVVARIGRAYGEGTRCLLIVPEQYTLQAEAEIVEGLRLPGYFDIDVLSPSRLRDRVFERAGQPQRVRIDERGKCMVLSAALEDLQDDLLFYRGAGGRTGFVQRLSALVADFKRGGLAPQDVAQLAGRTDGMLAMKLEDAGRVFAAYEARLAGSFVDGEDVQRELLARMEPSGVLAGAQIFIYGFDMITPTFAAQICAMARCAQELTLALTLDTAPARDAALYVPALRSLQRLEDLLREAGIPTGRERVAAPLNAPADIAHLERELYAYPMRPMRGAPERVSLHAAATPFAEVHVAAAHPGAGDGGHALLAHGRGLYGRDGLRAAGGAHLCAVRHPHLRQRKAAGAVASAVSLPALVATGGYAWLSGGRPDGVRSHGLLRPDG